MAACHSLRVRILVGTMQEVTYRQQGYKSSSREKHHKCGEPGRLEFVNINDLVLVCKQIFRRTGIRVNIDSNFMRYTRQQLTEQFTKKYRNKETKKICNVNQQLA